MDAKRCPCGGEVKVWGCGILGLPCGYAIGCTKCGLTLADCDTEEEAIKEWNDHPMHPYTAPTARTGPTEMQKAQFKFKMDLFQLTK